MPNISLLEIAQLLGSNAVSGMAPKVGLKWPPPPPISVRKVVALTPSAIAQKYAVLGGPAGKMGPPTGAEDFCSDNTGRFRSYKNGVIYWSGVAGTKAFEVDGPILTKLLADSPSPAFGPQQGLGYPTSDVATAGTDTFISHFQKGAMYSKPTTGTHAVWGPIFDLYEKLGEAGGVLGFPITDVAGLSQNAPVDLFGDFENGGLFSKGGGTATQLAATVGNNSNTRSLQFVLSQVNAILDAAVANYNNTKGPDDYAVAMQGGPALQDPNNPITDYSVIGALTQNRQYKLQQNLFVSVPIWKDVTIGITFDLLLSLAGPTSVAAKVTTASVNIDTHGNPAIPASDVQKYHDKIMVLASQAGADISLPVGISFLSAKVLTTPIGVAELTAQNFQDLGGPGALVLLFEPLL